MIPTHTDLIFDQMNDDEIITDDLEYSSSNGKYSFRFNYLGEGVFLLKSIGYIEEKSFRIQLQIGDKARARLSSLNNNLQYHLIWDVSEVEGISIISRSFIFTKLKDINKIASISFIGANSLSRSIGKIVSKVVPGVKFLYFLSLEDATHYYKLPEYNIRPDGIGNVYHSPDIDMYSIFIDRWQEKKDYLYIANRRLKVLYSENWKYSTQDKSFKVTISVVESNIIYYECEGILRTSNVEKVYAILGTILHEMGFNASDKKFYGIVNLRKVRRITLGGRKLTAFYENLYVKRIKMVILIPSNVIQLFFKVMSLISFENFSHWTINNSIDEAFVEILKHKEGNHETAQEVVKSSESVENISIPQTRREMIYLIEKQQKEIHDLKSHQHEQIQKILEITGRMSWDESFSESHLIPDSLSPFNEVYNLLHLLFQDFRDIINEKTLHAKLLKESEDKYRNFINLANDVIAVIQDGNLMFVNSRCESVLGYNSSEIVGQDMRDFVDIKERHKIDVYNKQRHDGADISSVYETILVHKNGNSVPVAISVGSLSYENRPAAMLIIRDITQNKKAEEELENYRNHLEVIIRERTIQLQQEITDRKIAEESDRLKTSFLSNMSHEIRTPMNAIIAFSNFLKNPNLPQSEREEYLNYIQSSGETLLNLINDIIDFSKIEAKQLNVSESYCNVDSLLDELYKYFENHLHRFKKFDVGLVLTIPNRSENTTIYTDVNRLKQILTNLLDNALKFTDFGAITFGYNIENQKIIFYVNDTGIGIPADKMNLIFQRFGKIDLSGRNFSGTGLGLAISNNLATLLNGNLWVRSKEGEGATFWLQLPLQQIEHLVAEDNPIEKPKVPNNYLAKRKILVVEDEDLNFKVLQIALQQRQVIVIRANNGKEAIDNLMLNNDIDLVLMDIQMPVMDGYESMSILKKTMPSMPIIAQTAFAMMEEKQRCLEKGFDDYISKPINLSELYEKIERLIKKD